LCGKGGTGGNDSKAFIFLSGDGPMFATSDSQLICLLCEQITSNGMLEMFLYRIHFDSSQAIFSKEFSKMVDLKAKNALFQSFLILGRSIVRFFSMFGGDLY
jgi:hypothetical protein